MHDGVGGERVAGRARIVAGVAARRALHVQRAPLVGQVRRDVNAPVRVVVDHPAVVVPKHVHRFHRALPDHALQVQRAIEHQVLLRGAGDLGLRLCKQTARLVSVVHETREQDSISSKASRKTTLQSRSVRIYRRYAYAVPTVRPRHGPLPRIPGSLTNSVPSVCRTDRTHETSAEEVSFRQ